VTDVLRTVELPDRVDEAEALESADPVEEVDEEEVVCETE
jgi:hypothetical protein